MPAVQNKLDEWKRQLLDLSKRNRLLHFRETRRQTLRVQQPDPGALFERIAISERPVTVVGLDQRTLLDSGTDISMKENGPAQHETIKSGELLFAGSMDRVATALYTLRSTDRTWHEERGVSVLYLAFGFLHWFEASQSDYEIASPLVLVPVELERDTALSPYRLVRRDDDIVPNPTLCKVMEDQFKLKLPEPPHDETWVLPAYFSAVAEEVSGQARWWIDESVYLAVFSFMKLSMYRDLEQSTAIAQNNVFVRALSGDSSALESGQGDICGIPTDELDDRVDPADCLQVLDADASQQEAIELAKAGVSFVLQGPPGTGKSQTIANIIAESLGLGRTILFVSEKAAALDVVHRRLTSAGLADGCLALHSHKANKRDVVRELARVYALGSGQYADEAVFNYDRLRERRAALNQYVRELHTRREPLMRSVFEVLGTVARLSKAPQVAFSVRDVVQLSTHRYELMRGSIARLAGSADTISRLHENSWRGSTLDGQSLETQRITHHSLELAHQQYSLAHESAKALAEALGLDDPALTPSRVDWMLRMGKALAHGPEFPGEWLDPVKQKYLAKLATEASEQHIEAMRARAAVRRVFSDSILEYDLDGLAHRLTSQYHSFIARLFGSAYRQELQILHKHARPGTKPNYHQLCNAVPAAIALRDRCAWVSLQESQLRDEFGPWYSGYQTDWSALQAALVWAQRVSQSFAGPPPPGFRARIATILADRAALLSTVEQAQISLDAARSAAAGIAQWFTTDAPSATAFATYESTPLVDALSQIDRLAGSIHDLEAWTRLVRAAKACMDSGLGDPIPLLESWDLPPEQYVDSFDRRVFTLWLDHWVSHVPVLRDFEVTSHTHLVMEFRKLDADLKHAASRTLARRLAQRRPHPAGASISLSSSQPALLMREARKKRRHKPLRRLFSEIPDLLMAIKPCLMMSPLSVSQFLQPGTVQFDTIVFDEASQVKPEDAIGAILRGKQTIIVGDRKQLPPTTFFDKAVSEEDLGEEEYDDDADAFESILDLCGTIGLPERMLRWHYRSRREGLIAFSNNHLYENHLVTFPSPDFDGGGTGVELRHIADGVYDRSRSRTNKREVQEVLRIVRSHAAQQPNKSLGVVAFSQAQATAIDRGLWQLRSTEPLVESFLGGSRDEPFFVKNLESVQGDERDVIVFSVGYGRDPAGRLSMNFGPLNARGGERRLNVAITRAREKVILVSSIRGADIDVSRTQAEGTRLLKHYLDYAERGVAALDSVCSTDLGGEYDSSFEEEVAIALRRLGYTIETQVGCSGYRVDLAVVHPSRPGQYALGIECDGASYHSAATARERDRLREQVLVNLGWRLYRIWSTDWFRAQQREVEKLKVAIEEAITSPGIVQPAVSGRSTRLDEQPPLVGNTDEAVTALAADHVSDLTSAYVEYHPPRQRGDFYAAHRAVKTVLISIIEAESPVHIDTAVRRTASAWGITRAGHRVRDVVMSAAGSAISEGSILRRGTFLYRTGESQVAVRRNAPGGDTRKAFEIAPEEIAEAARLILQDFIRLSRDDLIIATARLLGFERTGTDVRRVMSDGIDVLVDSGVAMVEHDAIFLAQAG